MRTRPSSRERILDAAEDVVLRRGAGGMSLNAVAAAARVSKGGLIYHFPSRRALLTAMLERFAAVVDARFERERARLPAGAARDLKALLLAWLKMGTATRRAGGALLAAIARDAELLKLARARRRARMRRLTAGAAERERAAIVLLAAEGLWMSELLCLSRFTAPERARIGRALLRLTDTCYAAPAAGDAAGAERR